MVLPNSVTKSKKVKKREKAFVQTLIPSSLRGFLCKFVIFLWPGNGQNVQIYRMFQKAWNGHRLGTDTKQSSIISNPDIMNVPNFGRKIHSSLRVINNGDINEFYYSFPEYASITWSTKETLCKIGLLLVTFLRKWSPK